MQELLTYGLEAAAFGLGASYLYFEIRPFFDAPGQIRAMNAEYTDMAENKVAGFYYRYFPVSRYIMIDDELKSSELVETLEERLCSVIADELSGIKELDFSRFDYSNDLFRSKTFGATFANYHYRHNGWNKPRPESPIVHVLEILAENNYYGKFRKVKLPGNNEIFNRPLKY
jgi:hypothetical protein